MFQKPRASEGSKGNANESPPLTQTKAEPVTVRGKKASKTTKCVLSQREIPTAIPHSIAATTETPNQTPHPRQTRTYVNYTSKEPYALGRTCR